MEFEFTPLLGGLMFLFGLLSFVPWIILKVQDSKRKQKEKLQNIKNQQDQ
jgi:flagellar biogenesis protein FliO